jgi:hypothetical protein
VIRATGIATPALRMAARTRTRLFTVEEAGRTQGRGNTTALAICLK